MKWVLIHIRMALAIALLFSCNSVSEVKSFCNLNIELKVKNIPIKLYIDKIENGKYIRIDSIDNTSEKTTIHIERLYDEPFLASLSTEKKSIGPMFIISNSKINIKTNEDKVEIGGGENDFMKDNFFLFSIPSHLNATRGQIARRARHATVLTKNQEAEYLLYLNDIEQIVKSRPDMFFVLYQLNFNRSYIEIKTLKHCLALMSPKLKHTFYYKELTGYTSGVENRTIGKSLPQQHLVLPNEKLAHLQSFLQRKQYSLLIFWASWCLPCRKEFPYLKNFYSEIDTSKIQFVPISLDDDYNSWNWAIDYDGISNWINLCVNKNDSIKNQLNKRLGIESIPQLLIVDSTGKIINTDPTLNTLKKILDELGSKDRM